MTTPTDKMREAHIELPDAIRVPLHSLHADAGYLVGRALKGDAELAVGRIRGLCMEIEEAVRAALSTLPAPAPEAQGANPWRDAIDAALVTVCLEPPGAEESPGDALDRLLCWEVQIALDPEVSSAAAALIERGRAEAQAVEAAERERIARHFDERDKGAGGFYDPHEPAEIIRQLGPAPAPAAQPAAQQAPAVPQGWRLVPVEPTPEMVKAGARCASSNVCWAEMLAAAPQPPAAGWQPIETAPKDGTHILVSWPMRALDDDDAPTGAVTSRSTLVTWMSGNAWVEPDYLGASGAWFGDDDAFASEPDLWTPLPAAPQAPAAPEGE